MNRNQFFKTTSLAAAGLGLLQTNIMAKLAKGQLPAKFVTHEQGVKMNVLGDELCLKISGSDTDGLFSLFVEEHEPGLILPLHVHANEDEVFQVQQGEVKYTVGNTTQILRAGDIAFGPRGVPHTWTNVGQVRARVNLMAFPAGLEDMFTELDQLPGGPPDLARVSEICGRYGIRFL